MSAPTLNQAQFAAHRCVSRKTVTGWKQRGLLVFSDDGKVDVLASDRRLLDHGILLPADLAGNSFADSIVTSLNAEIPCGTWTKSEAERVKENYSALLRQLSYDRESAAVVEIDDVVMAIRQEYSIVRARLAQIGANVAPNLAKLRSPSEIKAAVDAEITAALTELSDLVQ